MSDDIREQITGEDKDFLNQVEGKLKQDDKLLDKICSFVVDKVGKDTVVDFKSLEPAEKLQACVDYLAISLVSGNVSKNELKKMMDKHESKK